MEFVQNAFSAFMLNLLGQEISKNMKVSKYANDMRKSFLYSQCIRMTAPL